MAATFMVGIGLGAQWPGYGQLFWICVGIVALGLIRTIRRKGAAWVLPVLFCLILGYIAIQPWLCVKMPEQHVSHFTDQGWWKMQGVVADAPRLKGDRLEFVLSVTQVRNELQHHVVSGKVAVSTRESGLPQLRRGDGVVLTGRLRPIRNFANPGGFDYERFMALRTIRVRTYARKGSLAVVTTAMAKPWQRYVDGLRQVIANHMHRALAGTNRQASALLTALIVGQRDQISSELRQDFNRAGVGHVLAISGLHIGMVAAAAFGLTRWLLSWVPLMLAHAWTRKGAALISGVLVLFYALLAGLSPATQRALIMVTVILMGYWVGRRHDWLNALALAALIILMVYPPALLSVSFQLSFAAVLAIVVGLKAVPLKPSPLQAAWWRRWMRRWMALMWVSGLAIAGTLPLALYYFNQTSLVGLATNLAVVPLVGMVVVPAGLLGVLALAVNPFLAEMFWHIAATGLQVILWVVHGVAQWPWSAAQCVTPSIWEIFLYYLCVGVALGWRKFPRTGWVVMALCALWMVDAGYWSYQRFGRQDLRVTTLDVGQGSANLLQLPGGYTVLLDGGGFSDNAVFDVGERIVAPLLLRRKIKRVDLVILSHSNSDHLNGLFYILRHFHVAEVWSNHQPATTWGYRQWLQLIEKSHAKHTAFEALPSRQVRHQVVFTILGPPHDFMQRLGSEPWRDLNNNSMVVQIRFNRIAILFTGDIIAPAEADLITRHGINGLESTILMVPHHGSRHSSSVPFLQAVAPKEAVISSGWNNRFGFPHAPVLERLAALGVRVWNTAPCGAVQIVTDGQSYRVSAVRSTDPDRSGLFQGRDKR
jgi:competence protein ComEC